jgi:hypothetical protein
MADLRIPTSVIHGTVQTAGDATHGPFIQLLNPGGSGVNLFVYELRIAVDIASGTSRIRVRRTASPMTLGGTQTTGTIEHRDSRNVAAIKATLIGCTAVSGTLFTEAVSAWFDKIPAAGGSGVEPYHGKVLIPQTFPWIVVPGSAIEIANPDASATNFLRAFPVWDELPQ